MIFRSYVCFCPPKDFSLDRRNCSHFFCTEKPIRFNNKFFSITTICFVSFLYSVFNEHNFSLSRQRKLHLRSKLHSLANFTFALAKNSLRTFVRVVGPSGLEPPTSCLSGTRSNLLSYEPMWLVWIFSHLGA